MIEPKLPLGLRLDVNDIEDDLPTLTDIEAFDLGPVESALIKRFPAAWNDVPTWVREFRRFVALVRLHDGPLPMFSPLVDEVWHELILRTRTYAAFCDMALGRFLHHEVGAAPPDASGSACSFSTFAAIYERHFGPLPDCWRSRALPG